MATQDAGKIDETRWRLLRKALQSSLRSMASGLAPERFQRLRSLLMCLVAVGSGLLLAGGCSSSADPQLTSLGYEVRPSFNLNVTSYSSTVDSDSDYFRVWPQTEGFWGRVAVSASDAMGRTLSISKSDDTYEVEDLPYGTSTVRIDVKRWLGQTIETYSIRVDRLTPDAPKEGTALLLPGQTGSSFFNHPIKSYYSGQQAHRLARTPIRFRDVPADLYMAHRYSITVPDSPIPQSVPSFGDPARETYPINVSQKVSVAPRTPVTTFRARHDYGFFEDSQGRPLRTVGLVTNVIVIDELEVSPERIQFRGPPGGTGLILGKWGGHSYESYLMDEISPGLYMLETELDETEAYVRIEFTDGLGNSGRMRVSRYGDPPFYEETVGKGFDAGENAVTMYAWGDERLFRLVEGDWEQVTFPSAGDFPVFPDDCTESRPLTGAVVVGSFAATADSIYWGCSASRTRNTGIYKAEVDGSGVKEVVPDARATGLFVDQSRGKVYWSQAEARGQLTARSLHRANLDGSGIETIISEVRPARFTVDTEGAVIYWIELLDVRRWKIRGIFRANLDGSDAKRHVRFGEYERASYLAVDSVEDRICWTQRNSIECRDNESGLFDPFADSVVTSSRSNFVYSVQIDSQAGKIYWQESDGNWIRRADKDGSNVETVAILPSGTSSYYLVR